MFHSLLLILIGSDLVIQVAIIQANYHKELHVFLDSDHHQLEYHKYIL